MPETGPSGALQGGSLQPPHLLPTSALKRFAVDSALTTTHEATAGRCTATHQTVELARQRRIFPLDVNHDKLHGDLSLVQCDANLFGYQLDQFVHFDSSVTWLSE